MDNANIGERRLIIVTPSIAAKRTRARSTRQCAKQGVEMMRDQFSCT
jgi:hypothetical protein